jgi:hypothetical protein
MTNTDNQGAVGAAPRHVHQDTAVTVNWLRFNVPQLLAILAATVSITIYVNSLKTDIAVEQNKVANMESARAARQVLIDAQISSLTGSLNTLKDTYGNLPYRVETNTSAIAQARQDTNTSVDKVVNSIETLRNSVNTLANTVSTQSVKIDDLTKKLDNSVSPRTRMRFEQKAQD